MQGYRMADTPWQVVATDLFTFEHRDYIVITDYFSNYFVLGRLVRTKTYDVVDKIKKKQKKKHSRVSEYQRKLFRTTHHATPVKSLADFQENGTSNILHCRLNIHSRTERLKMPLRPVRG